MRIKSMTPRELHEERKKALLKRGWKVDLDRGWRHDSLPSNLSLSLNEAEELEFKRGLKELE